MKYMSVDDIIKSGKYPFTLGQLRDLLIKRKKNGLQSVVRKIGKRVYLKMDDFEKWIDTHVDEGENLGEEEK